MATNAPFKVDGVDYSRERVAEMILACNKIRGYAEADGQHDAAAMFENIAAVLEYLNELPRPEECTDCGD